MNNKETEQRIKYILEHNLFAVVYPKDKTFESAEKMAELIDSSLGVAQFEDENKEICWGVLIDKVKEIKKYINFSSIEEKK